MSVPNFQPFALSGLADDEREDDVYDDWLVVSWLTGEDTLWDETNFFALESLIEAAAENQRHWHKIESCSGFPVLIVSPDAEALLALCESAVGSMLSGNHIDASLYTSALDERIDDYWENLSAAERIATLQNSGECLAHVRSLQCPDDLRHAFEEVVGGYQ